MHRCPQPDRPAYCAEVYESQVSPLTARVTAALALLQAGLERAARRAGLRLVGPAEPALIALHTGGEGPAGAAGAPVDVSAASDHVTVTITDDLGPEAWAALHVLVRELLGVTNQR